MTEKRHCKSSATYSNNQPFKRGNMQKKSIGFDKINYQTKLAPALAWDKGAPVINGPDIYGASPGKDFLYLIPTLGERPMSFSAENLPKGLSVRKNSGIISGKAEKEGEYQVILNAENMHGKFSKVLKIVIRENAISLTPPMGWNSWNCFRSEITDEKIRSVADDMISSGLAARGYSYVNMDSGWQSKMRGGKFNSIVPKSEFRDMNALSGHVHALGLKIGIYSSPYVIPWGTEGCGTTSGLCDTNFTAFHQHTGKYIGLTKHEHEDVSQWSDWGIDYFKYDWTETDMILTERMSRELRKSSRDIVFSITVRVNIKDASEVMKLANLWRSNTDTHPEWDSVLKNGFANQEWNRSIGSGHWFDLDMTAIRPRDGKCLSRNELIACISCWMMRPSPILIDCIPSEIDDFTMRLLCNEEIIAVNQDSLGKPAMCIYKDETWDIQLKPLSDSSYAMAYFNLSGKPAIAPEFKMEKYGGKEIFLARDLWAREDLGRFENNDFIVGVDSHCAKIFKLSFQQ